MSYLSSQNVILGQLAREGEVRTVRSSQWDEGKVTLISQEESSLFRAHDGKYTVLIQH